MGTRLRAGSKISAAHRRVDGSARPAATRARPPIGLYARVSTGGQTAANQLDALRAYAERRGAEATEYVDKGISGSRDRRPALDAMMTAVQRREISAVVVVKLDRLARSLRHLANLAADLDSLGVSLVVLDQAIDTSTPTGRLLFGVLASVAEFERELIRERTLAGLARARRQGRTPGRPASIDQRALARATRLHASGKSVREIASLLGVSKSAVGRALNTPTA